MRSPHSRPKNLTRVIELTERIVVKIGGATLFHPDGFRAELSKLLSVYAHAQVWVIVGGGELVEAMRTVHQLVPALNEEQMHWRCVELLDHTWAIAKEIFPIGISIANREDLTRASAIRDLPGVFWVRVQSYYSSVGFESLPNSWQPQLNWSTTTDSLAWLLGKIVEADRVVLFKQCECDPSWTLGRAAELGIIDTELSRLVDANPDRRPIIELWQVTRSPLLKPQ